MFILRETIQPLVEARREIGRRLHGIGERENWPCSHGMPANGQVCGALTHAFRHERDFSPRQRGPARRPRRIQKRAVLETDR